MQNQMKAFAHRLFLLCFGMATMKHFELFDSKISYKVNLIDKYMYANKE